MIRKEKAFSLVELLLALAIVSTGVLTMIGLLGAGMKFFSQDRSEKAMVTAMEEIQSKFLSQTNWNTNILYIDSFGNLSDKASASYAATLTFSEDSYNRELFIEFFKIRGGKIEPSCLETFSAKRILP